MTNMLGFGRQIAGPFAGVIAARREFWDVSFSNVLRLRRSIPVLSVEISADFFRRFLFFDFLEHF